MKPLTVSFLYGHERRRARSRRASRCVDARERTGLTEQRFEDAALACWIGKVGGSRIRGDARRARRIRLPQQPARRTRARAGRVPRGGRGGARAVRRRAHRRVHGHEYFGRTPHRARVSRAAADANRRICPTGSTTARRRARLRSPSTPAIRLGLDGIDVGGLRRLRVEREGFRLRGARHRGGLLRRGRRRWRRQPVSDHAVRLQCTAAASRPTSAGRRMRNATACRSAKPAVSRCSSARPTPGAARLSRRRRNQRCAPHVAAAPGRRRSRWRRCARARAITIAARVSYINLHGTATPANDAAEDAAVTALFGASVPCSSTKGWTGHTLGAAGIVEAAISLLAIEHGFLPRSLNTRDARSQAACRGAARGATRAGRLRVVEFLRLRRHQLRAAVRTRAMTVCCVRSVGIAAPGLAGWAARSHVLRGRRSPIVPAAESAYAPALLPPNERRRATAAVRQAFRAAEDAIGTQRGCPRHWRPVFASSDARHGGACTGSARRWRRRRA